MTHSKASRPAMPMRDGAPDIEALLRRNRAEFGGTRMDAPTGLKEQAKQARALLDSKRTEAKGAWTTFAQMRDSMVKEGVNLLAPENKDKFAKLDDASKAHDAIAQEVAELEVGYARLLEMAGETMPEGVTRGGDGGSAANAAAALSAWGTRYTESDVFQRLKAQVERSGSSAIGTSDPVAIASRQEILNVLSGTITTGAGAGAALFFEQRLSGIYGTPMIPLTVLDLITIGETDERMVSWVVEVLFQNNAAETAENTTKPQSHFGFEDRSTSVVDIAHWTKVTRQTLRDQAAIRSWIDRRMMDGVRRRLAQQVITGDGTGVNLLGIYNQAGIIEHVKGTDPMIEYIHKMITKVRVTYRDEPTAIGLHPYDWEQINLSKTEQGLYYYGGPTQQGPATIWGKPVAVSVDFPEGSPAVGNFKEANLWVREGVSVQATDTNEDDFVTNRVTIRSEMAGAFGLLQPAAIAIAVAA